MKRIIGFFLILGILFSCSNEKLISSLNSIKQADELTINELNALVTLKDNKKVSEEKAKSRVLDFVNNTQSRSNKENEIFIASSKKEIFKSNTGSRSTESVITQDNEEIELYAFSLSDAKGDSAGFAIASGDERLPAILAYSDNGNLENDITDDFLYSFFLRLPDYINNKIAEYNNINEEELNTAIKKAENKPEDSRGTTSYIKIIEQYGPLVPVEWGQRAPYSDVINSKNNDTGLLSGCVAIAISQIMASHKHATGGNYNWDKMTSKTSAKYLDSSTKNMVATLVYNVAEAVHMDYGKDGSGANSKYADDCFDKMGYSTPSSLQGYNLDIVKASLKNGNSVYTRANAKKTTNKVKIFGITVYSSTSYSEGHAYVVDGYSVRTQKITITIPFSGKTTIEVPFTYLHVNFGWSGYKNGYYAAGTFDSNAGPAFTRAGTSGNYQYNIEVLPNVSPR